MINQSVCPLRALAPRSACLASMGPTLNLQGSECEVVAEIRETLRLVDGRLEAITLRHGGVDLPIALSALQRPLGTGTTRPPLPPLWGDPNAT
jgi:hypothetical protein